jgi:hypothetical protein
MPPTSLAAELSDMLMSYHVMGNESDSLNLVQSSIIITWYMDTPTINSEFFLSLEARQKT